MHKEQRLANLLHGMNHSVHGAQRCLNKLDVLSPHIDSLLWRIFATRSTRRKENTIRSNRIILGPRAFRKKKRAAIYHLYFDTVFVSQWSIVFARAHIKHFARHKLCIYSIQCDDYSAFILVASFPFVSRSQSSIVVCACYLSSAVLLLASSLYCFFLLLLQLLIYYLIYQPFTYVAN